MPAAPPCNTLKPFMTRPLLRWQATILPTNTPGGAAMSHSGRLYGGADARTTGNGPTPAVTDAPVNVAVSAPAARVRVDANSRRCVEAATVVTQGERWLAVPAPGPLLPAEVATNTPAAYASRNANSTGSVSGVVPPEIE